LGSEREETEGSRDFEEGSWIKSGEVFLEEIFWGLDEEKLKHRTRPTERRSRSE
jgi:hypothetical protein